MYLGGGPVSRTGDLGVSSLGTHPRGPGIYLGEDATSKANNRLVADIQVRPAISRIINLCVSDEHLRS